VGDSQIQSRSSAPFTVATVATPGSAEAPTRGHSARPIRFTPSRVEPIAAPPVERGAPAERSPLASRVAAWLLVTAGWGVFAAWWAVVLHRESIQSIGFALGLLASMAALSAIAMTLWTRHNIRIALKGKRGKSSLYIPMVWNRDTLGRPLDLPAPEIARSAPEVRIVLRAGVKAYIAVDEEEL
jgi:hypothetical protein